MFDRRSHCCGLARANPANRTAGNEHVVRGKDDESFMKGYQGFF